jgi:NADPH:quinone reductase-like Zn-dependent oxidoreductase
VQDAYGESGVLQLRDIDKPELAHDEVLVRAYMRPAWTGASGTS